MKVHGVSNSASEAIMMEHMDFARADGPVRTSIDLINAAQKISIQPDRLPTFCVHN